MQYIKIHSQDNVAVALADMTSGSVVTIDNDTVTLSQDVVRGHKFALRAIAKGENVIKYGLPIGHALADIAPGEHVHAHNTRTNLSDLDAYRYQPDLVEQPTQPADRDVEIYRRASGEVGVRNELWILPTVGCVNGIARQIHARLEDVFVDFPAVRHAVDCQQRGFKRTASESAQEDIRIVGREQPLAENAQIALQRRKKLDGGFRWNCHDSAHILSLF